MSELLWDQAVREVNKKLNSYVVLPPVDMVRRMYDRKYKQLTEIKVVNAE